jgi:nicotinamidase/pyrazinamidase
MTVIFVDVDTQLDFLCPAGALYAPGAEKISGNVAALTRYASEHGVKIVSTVDAHAENDPEFRTWKPHGVLGTVGQQKLAAGLLARRYVLSTVMDVLDSSAAGAAQQVIVEKQNVDCFTNPSLAPLLSAWGASRVVLYGLVTEVCVEYAARGLLQRGYTVNIVSDAIQAFSPEAGRQALDRLARNGAVLTQTRDVMG